MDISKEDLETYQLQLSQVELALTSEPENADLIHLRSEPVQRQLEPLGVVVAKLARRYF